jgi:8-oxo-dGTP pyrophosphatase MutT (NUDIX family)
MKKKKEDEKKYKPLSCRNCGLFGHVYKNCPHPIMSYGIICYKIENNEIKYLMLQRKDSLCFMEFIRGKYQVSDMEYIKFLISNMTLNERNMLVNNSFDDIWNYLWCQNPINPIKNTKEYLESKSKFETLANSNFFKNYTKTIASIFNEQEFGFPKGRRKIKENDIDCAIREFYEETKLKKDDLIIYDDIEPYEEIFFGTNNVLYKHSYYIAKLKNNNINPSIDHNCIDQIREVRALKWFNNIEVLAHIKKYNIERIELFKYVDINIKQIEKNK